MSDIKELIAGRLAEARQELGWSISEAARRCGFNRARYSNWELAYRMPQYNELYDVGKVFGVDPAWLCGWTDEKMNRSYRPVARNTVEVNGDTTQVINATDITAYRRDYLVAKGHEAGALIGLRIEDDTMSGILQRGDIVIANTQQRRSEIRDLFAILVGERAWVRWIRPELNGTFTLSAEDGHQYPDETLTKDQLDQLAIIGRVVRIERDR